MNHNVRKKSFKLNSPGGKTSRRNSIEKRADSRIKTVKLDFYEKTCK